MTKNLRMLCRCALWFAIFVERGENGKEEVY